MMKPISPWTETQFADGVENKQRLDEHLTEVEGRARESEDLQKRFPDDEADALGDLASFCWRGPNDCPRSSRYYACPG
ncbi:hypothetical protein [Nocardia sp. NPDC003979]